MNSLNFSNRWYIYEKMNSYVQRDVTQMYAEFLTRVKTQDLQTKSYTEVQNTLCCSYIILIAEAIDFLSRK